MRLIRRPALAVQEKGHNVVGVKGVDNVVKKFFEENSINYSVSRMDGDIGNKYEVRIYKYYHLQR
jgi:hypothetical protein